MHHDVRPTLGGFRRDQALKFGDLGTAGRPFAATARRSSKTGAVPNHRLFPMVG